MGPNAPRGKDFVPRSRRGALTGGASRFEESQAMRFDHFTVESQEALERAQRLAREHGHQEIDVERGEFTFRAPKSEPAKVTAAR